MKKINKKILIVEDDKSFFWILNKKLTEEGFLIINAEDGEEGLKRVEEKPDLILLDIMMPKMDGIEMAKKMKEMGKNIPIIFLTNMSDVEHMSNAISTVPADYFIKSDMSIDKITEVVKKKLGV